MTTLGFWSVLGTFKAKLMMVWTIAISNAGPRSISFCGCNQTLLVHGLEIREMWVWAPSFLIDFISQCSIGASETFRMPMYCGWRIYPVECEPHTLFECTWIWYNIFLAAMLLFLLINHCCLLMPWHLLEGSTYITFQKIPLLHPSPPQSCSATASGSVILWRGVKLQSAAPRTTKSIFSI